MLHRELGDAAQLFFGTIDDQYLRVKRKRLTGDSYRDYESGLDKLARYFPDLRVGDFEPPTGTQRLEEFLDYQWGDSAPRTYNKGLSIIRDFFRWQIPRGKLHGDPTLLIERAKSRQVYRTTFSTDQRRAILAAGVELRDRIALRLLLDYALRKGALRVVQIKHFDHQRRRLTVFTKGQKVRELPLPHAAFWTDPGTLHPRIRSQTRPLPHGPTHRPLRQGRPDEADRPPRAARLVVPAPRSRRHRGRGHNQRASGCTRPGTPLGSAFSTPPGT